MNKVTFSIYRDDFIDYWSVINAFIIITETRQKLGTLF